MPAGPSGKGNADAASGKDMGGRGRDGGNGGKKKNKGFQPSPSSTTDHTPEGQRKATEAHRRANKIGRFAGLGPDRIDYDDMRALSQYPIGTPKLKEAKKEHQKSLARSYRGLSATAAWAGSKIFGGVNSELTVNDEGSIGFQDSYSPTEQALGFTTKATSPIVGGLAALNNLNSLSGEITGSKAYSHPSVSSFRTIDEATDQRLAGEERRRGNLEGDNGSGFLSGPKPKSIYETAAQTLYPQEEEKKLLGVGVTQGVSKVRKAPTLSALNIGRAQFGRG